MKTDKAQRFKCNVCGKSWTGVKMEHCRVCHETFNDTRAGDRHRKVAYTYTIAKHPNGKLEQFMSDENVPLPLVIVSQHNQMRYCFNAIEMKEEGLSQEKNGAWNNGGKAYIPKLDK